MPAAPACWLRPPSRRTPLLPVRARSTRSSTGGPVPVGRHRCRCGRRRRSSTNPYALPARPTGSKFADAWTSSNYGTYFWNSLDRRGRRAVALLTVIGAMAAHCLARYRFRGSRAVRFVILSGMILPPQLLILSLFQILLDFGLYNTLAGLIARLRRDPARDDRLHPRGLLRADPAGPVRCGAAWTAIRDFEIFWRITLPIGLPALFTTVIAQLHHPVERVPLRRRAADRRRQAHAAARHHAFHGRPPARRRHDRDRADDRDRCRSSCSTRSSPKR